MTGGGVPAASRWCICECSVDPPEMSCRQGVDAVQLFNRETLAYLIYPFIAYVVLCCGCLRRPKQSNSIDLGIQVQQPVFQCAIPGLGRMVDEDESDWWLKPTNQRQPR